MNADTKLNIWAYFRNPISEDMIRENICEAIEISKKYDLPVTFKYKRIDIEIDKDTNVEMKLIWIAGYLAAMKKI